jgi:hypothetical protein
MPEHRFSARVQVAREPGDVFAWVADHRNVARVLDGVLRWEPLSGRDRGRGAPFDVAVGAMGLRLETVLVLDTWDEPRAIGWRSESGPVSQSGIWRFEPAAGGTAVTLGIRYLPPGGALGSLLAGQVEGLARARLEDALERMKEILEVEPDRTASGGV